MVKMLLKKYLWGANALQLYTALVYKGPKVVNMILEDLSKKLKEKRIKNVNDLVGKKLSMNNPLKLNSFAEIYESYDNFIIDLWGVVHNGVKIFDGILEVLEKIKISKKKVFFMTNAPRRSYIIESQLSDFGLRRDLYECVISSGEVTWYFLKKKKYRFCHIIGPERDYNLIDGLNYEIAKTHQQVEVIINTGPWGFEDTLDNYKPLLNSLVKTKPIMICSNPDKIVVRGNKFVICAGLLAEYYELIGGKVIYYGKPYNEIYEFCYQKISNKTKKTLVVGDSLDNDIKGANEQNLDSLLVIDGIHREVNGKNGVDKEKLNDLIKKNVNPKYYIKELIF